jgi:[acyl-carrier-protein] S-malonyltransferase
MSRNVLLFPGQGAQTVGMQKDVYENFPAAREVFHAASEAISEDIAAVCFEGPAEQLERTDVCQPAILTASIAVLRAIESEAGCRMPVSGAAGLSLGEYTALVAGGAVEFTDAVHLVHARGVYMHEACEETHGTMYSIIGLQDEQVEDICSKVQAEGGKVWPANYNAPGQVVISGEVEAAARAANRCKEAGAKRTVQLKVAGAFHTPLMQPAAGKLVRKLAETAFHKPAFPVVSNTTAEPIVGPENIRDLLARQLTFPVRWSASMQWFIAGGPAQYYEVGPGRVLTGLLKRIDAAQPCMAIVTASDVETVARTLRG